MDSLVFHRVSKFHSLYRVNIERLVQVQFIQSLMFEVITSMTGSYSELGLYFCGFEFESLYLDLI